MVVFIVVAVVVFLLVLGNQMTKARVREKARLIRGSAALQGRHMSKRDARLAAQEQLRQQRRR